MVSTHCELDFGDMNLGKSNETTLGHGQQLFKMLSRSNVAVRSYGLDTHFQLVCMHSDFDHEDMTLSQNHDKPSCHGQQMCKILSRSNETVRSHASYTDLW